MFKSIPQNKDLFRHVSTYCKLSDNQRITLGYFYSLCPIDPTWIFVKNIDVYMCGMLLSQSKNMQPVSVKTTNFPAFATFLYRDELKTKNNFTFTTQSCINCHKDYISHSFNMKYVRMCLACNSSKCERQVKMSIDCTKH